MNSKYVAKLTIEKAQESDQISLIVKEKGNKFATGILTKLISELCRYIPNEFNENDKVLFAENIHREFWDLKIDDIVLCFKQAINGHYGKVYGNLSYIQISEWLHDYWTEKLKYGEGKDAQFKETYDADRIGESVIGNFKKYYLK